MPTINGIDFYVSDEFSPKQAARIYGWLQQATTGANVSAFLSQLPNKTFYITKHVDESVAQSWYAEYAGGKELSPRDFYITVPESDGSNATLATLSPSGIVENITVDKSFADTGALEPDDSSTPYIPTPTGKQQLDPARALFHELAHAVTVFNANLSDHQNFGLEGAGFPGAEAIAVAAENLIYVKDHGGVSRIPYRSVAGDQTVQSFDPKSLFSDVATVQYRTTPPSDGDPAGSYDGEFYGSTSDGGEIDKIYGNTSDPANYIVVEAHKHGVVGDGLQVSQTFDDAMSGILASPDEVEMKLARVHNALAGLQGGLQVLETQTSAGDGPTVSNLSGLSLTNLNTVIGNANDRFLDNGVNDIGPVDANGSSALGFHAAEAAILIGSSGYSEGALTDDTLAPGGSSRLSRATDNLVAFKSGQSVLIAGNGPAQDEGNYNQLRGGDDSDIFVGGNGRDAIRADSGADLVVQSAGADVVYGDGQTAFAADPLAVNPVFDVTRVSDGLLDVVDSYDSTSTTTLRNVHMFVGNDSLTTFVGSQNSKDVFVAGSGGGDFTLCPGDVAIGCPTAVNGNTYRVSSGSLGNIAIVGFGPNDKLYIDGNLFTGVDVTFATTGNYGETGSYDMSVDASSSYPVAAPETQLIRGYGGPDNLSYGFAAGEYSDVDYTPDTTGNSGILHIFDQNLSVLSPRYVPPAGLGPDPNNVTTNTDLRLHIYGSSSSVPGISFNYQYGDLARLKPFTASGSLIPFFQSSNDPLTTGFDTGSDVNTLLNVILDSSSISVGSPSNPDSSNRVFVDSPGTTLRASSAGELLVIGSTAGNYQVDNFDPTSVDHETIELSKSIFSDYTAFQAAATQQGNDVSVSWGSGRSLLLKGVKLASLSPSSVSFGEQTNITIEPSSTSSANLVDIGARTDSSFLDQASGAISFDASDVSQGYTAEITSLSVSGATGSLPSVDKMLSWLTLGAVANPSSQASGSVDWAFAAQDGSLPSLLAGQSVTLTYALRVVSSDNSSAVQNVSITLNGLQGSTGDDTIQAGDGDLTLNGNGGSDVLIAGNGNDTLVGGPTGYTSFRVGAGSYNYSIEAKDLMPSWKNGRQSSGDLQWTGIAPADVIAQAQFNGKDVLLTVLGSTETILLQDELTGTPVVNSVTFDDGTTWSAQYIDNMTTSQGGGGGGSGPTTIQGTSGDDVLQAGSGDTIIYGNGGNDTLIAGPGNDTLSGGPTGHVIFEIGAASYNYEVEAADLMPSWKQGRQSSGELHVSDISPDSVQAYSNGEDVVLTVIGTSEQITLQDELTSTPVVDSVSFDDGTSWTSQQLAKLASTPSTINITSGAITVPTLLAASPAGSQDTMSASTSIAFQDADPVQAPTATLENEQASGSVSNDIANGSLSQALTFSNLSDTINGSGSASATFQAPSSAFDYLVPGQSVDLTYIYDIHDGAYSAQQTVDVVVQKPFDAPIVTSTASFTTADESALPVNAADLLATVTVPDAGDAISLQSVHDPVGGSVLLNSDGSVTFTPDPTFTGAASFEYSVSDSTNTVVQGTSSVQVTPHQILGTSSDDVLAGDGSPAIIDGRGGNDTLTAGSSGDILIAGTGNDTLTGGVGADTFSFGDAFGDIVIQNFATDGSSHDVLSFSTSVFADWAHLLGATQQSGSDLLITAPDGNTITLQNVQLTAFTSNDARFG